MSQPAPKVLISEDDPNMAHLLETYLRREGYEVVFYIGTAEGFADRVRTVRPDIVLMDIVLPGGDDGITLAERLRQEFEIPLVFITGRADEETIRRAVLTDPAGYLIKPFKLTELVATMQVAHARHRLERNLKSSREEMAHLLDTATEARFLTDDLGRLRQSNAAARRLTGVDSHYHVGSSLLDRVQLLSLQSGEPDPTLGDFLLAVPRVGGKRVWQADLLTPEGLRQRVTCTAQRLGDAGGCLVELRAEQNGLPGLATLTAAMDLIQEAVMVTASIRGEAEARILFANQAFAHVTGIPVGEVAGRMLAELGLRAPADDWSQCLAAGKPFQCETSLPHREGGTRTVSWTCNLVGSPEEPRWQVVHVLRDVTALRQLEEAIRQAQKIEAVGQLASGIAHDFNNILSIVNSYADLLLRAVEGQEIPGRYARSIRVAGEKGAALVSQLMMFTRRQQSGPVCLDLPEVVQALESMVRRLIREDIELRLDLGASRAFVYGEQTSIEQILVNLCVNARDAMPSGGRLTVGLEVVSFLESFHTGFGTLAPGDYARLSVTDTGVGMDEATLRRIFEPFFTTKELGKGTGLGLATVYNILLKLRAGIAVSSTPGRGTCFSIYIPLVPPGETPAGATESNNGTEGGASPEPGRHERILLVEDDSAFNECLRGVLTASGYRVESCADGKEAFDTFGESIREFDLLLTDIVMPRMSGRELAARLHERNPDLHILFMTGYDDRQDGFYHLPPQIVTLNKPFSLNQLLIQVRTTLESAAVRSEQIRLPEAPRE